jgi:UDP-N-acetylglucosamine/UDP-N-acetylgalactosamine diphosphorylase
MRAAGLSVPTDATGLPPFAVEVSPLFAVDEESFARSWSLLDPKPALAEGLCLGPQFS